MWSLSQARLKVVFSRQNVRQLLIATFVLHLGHNPVAFGGTHFRAHLDAHVHLMFFSSSNSLSGSDLGARFNDNVLRQLNTHRQSKMTSVQILLSPSYLVDSPDLEELKGRTELITEWNRKTSEAVLSTQGKAFGACGAGSNWQELSNKISECLNLPGMIGIKLRFGDSRLVAEPGYTNLRKALSEAHVQPRFVLIHMHAEYSKVMSSPKSYNSKQREEILKRDRRDIQALLELAKEYSQIQFVIGHGLSASALVEVLNRENPSRTNLWIETSFALNQFVPDESQPVEKRTSIRDHVEAWRKFGIDRVLFGSDQVIGQSEYVRSGYDNGYRTNDQLEQIEHNPFLTPAEKTMILQSNSEEFIRKITRL